MGKFIYDGNVRVDFDDRTLAHLQLVIGTKLRRGEPFHFTWKDDTSIGNGRTTVWVHPRCTLVYKYYGAESRPSTWPGSRRSSTPPTHRPVSTSCRNPPRSRWRATMKRIDIVYGGEHYSVGAETSTRCAMRSRRQSRAGWGGSRSMTAKARRGGPTCC
nr:hypothetical protein GCM10025699_32880 [Microbacterium flavescens]